jgi:hypothetical protein
MQNGNFSILYKRIELNAVTNQEEWTVENVETISIRNNGFVYVVGLDGKEFILPSHVISRIDKLI